MRRGEDKEYLASELFGRIEEGHSAGPPVDERDNKRTKISKCYIK